MVVDVCDCDSALLVARRNIAEDNINVRRVRKVILLEEVINFFFSFFNKGKLAIQ